MDNGVKVFTDEEFGFLRSVKIRGQTWFVASDVCRILDIRNPRMATERLDNEDKDAVSLTDTIGRMQTMTVVSESGLYSLILGSRKPEARKFKHWITSEVLPSIRKHGLYATDELLANPDFAIGILEELKKEREAKRNAILENQRIKNELAIKEQQIAESQPWVNYYNMVLSSKDLLPITIIAKDYGLSGATLNSLLNEYGVQYRQGKTWLLYSQYASQGYTQTKTYPYKTENGDTHTAVNTYWTQAGRLFIYDVLKKHGILPTIEKRDTPCRDVPTPPPQKQHNITSKALPLYNLDALNKTHKKITFWQMCGKDI